MFARTPGASYALALSLDDAVRSEACTCNVSPGELVVVLPKAAPRQWAGLLRAADDDEVIEVGADGTFDVAPAPRHEKRGAAAAAPPPAPARAGTSAPAAEIYELD